ncbi:MAG: ThiF family adenylyltransferase [Planctomycetota bacterium]
MSTASDQPSNDRYARQRQYPPIGQAGQAAIQRSDVAIVGCGALGTVAAEILARAGVGRLRLIDRDVVEWTNLQRQSLFDEADARAGVAKAAAAADRLSQINRQISIQPLVHDLDVDNIRDLLRDVDLVIDAADNFAVRLLLNDWSLATKTPWVHGGCVGAEGQVRLFPANQSFCFRCLVPQLPPPGTVATCDTAGVLGSATHTIASLQATEALKWLSGNRQAVCRDVTSIDLWNNRIRQVSISDAIRKTCPACRGDYGFLDGRESTGRGQAESLCGRNAIQISGDAGTRLDLTAAAQRWESLGQVTTTPFFARLHLSDKQTLTLFRDGRAVISGTDDTTVARSLYDRYVG